MAVQRPEATDDAPRLPGRSIAEDGGRAIFLASRGMAACRQGKKVERPPLRLRRSRRQPSFGQTRPSQRRRGPRAQALSRRNPWRLLVALSSRQRLPARDRRLRRAKRRTPRDLTNEMVERRWSTTSRVAARADLRRCRVLTANDVLPGADHRLHPTLAVGIRTSAGAPHCARRPCPVTTLDGICRGGALARSRQGSSPEGRNGRAGLSVAEEPGSEGDAKPLKVTMRCLQ